MQVSDIYIIVYSLVLSAREEQRLIYFQTICMYVFAYLFLF